MFPVSLVYIAEHGSYISIIYNGISTQVSVVVREDMHAILPTSPDLI